jgi:hypothetical protein
MSNLNILIARRAPAVSSVFQFALQLLKQHKLKTIVIQTKPLEMAASNAARTRQRTCLFLRCSLSTTLVSASDNAAGSNRGLLLCCAPLLPTCKHTTIQTRNALNSSWNSTERTNARAVHN